MTMLIKKNRAIRILLSAMLSFLSVRGMQSTIQSDDHALFGNSLLSMLLFMFSFPVFYLAIDALKRRYIIFSAIIGFGLALAEIWGRCIFFHLTIPSASPSFFIRWAGLGCLFGSMLLLFFRYFLTFRHFMNPTLRFRALFSAKQHAAKYTLVISTILFLCWVPSWIAAFPGVFAYDAPHQFWQFYTNHIANNQPVCSSAILYGIISFGKLLFGSYVGGLAFYICLQMLFGAFSLGYCCNFLREEEVPPFIQILIIASFALSPIQQLFIVNATKDVPFAIFVVLIVVLLLQMLRNPKRAFSSAWKQIALCLLLLAVMLYRNNGIYSVILFAPAFIIVFRRYWKNIILLYLAAIAPYVIITGPIYDQLHFGRSSIVEALAIPSQQLANAYANHGNQFTVEQRNIMFETMPAGTQAEYKQKYVPGDSDYIRPQMNGVSLKGTGLIRFLKNYISIGLRFPLDYWNALLGNTLGYWYPDLRLPSSFEPGPAYIEYSNSVYQTAFHIQRLQLWPSLSRFYFNIGEKGTYSNIPVLSMLFSPGFICWSIFICAMLLWCHKKRVLLLPFVFLFTLWLTTFAGPVVLMRYIYPFALTLPIVIGILFARTSWYQHSGKPLKHIEEKQNTLHDRKGGFFSHAHSNA